MRACPLWSVKPSPAAPWPFVLLMSPATVTTTGGGGVGGGGGWGGVTCPVCDCSMAACWSFGWLDAWIVLTFVVAGGFATLTCAGCAAGGEFCTACWTLAGRLPETVLLMPLAATVAAVGMLRAPPVWPGVPLSCARMAEIAESGAGAGAEGQAPGAATLTSKLGREMVCAQPLCPVTCTALP